MFLDDSTILKTLEVIASMQDDLNYQIVINSGSSTVDRYLRNKTGYVQENAQYECDALYGSAYCDMNGFFYPCRSYQGKGIDLKRKVNWEKEYAIFNDFLQKLFCSAEAVCPLKKRKDSSLDILAEKKLTELSVPDYQINQTIIFNKVDDRYFIIFCKTNEYVEYTQEGFMIYHLLSNNMSTCSIASQLQYTVEDVWNFLDSELIKKRIAYHRKEKELNRDKIV